MFAYLKTAELLPGMSAFWASLALAAAFFVPLALIFSWMNRHFAEGRPERSW